MVYINSALSSNKGMFASHRENTRRALTGQSLRGRKVRSLYNNLIGDEACVSVDRWVLRYYGIGKGNGDGEVRGIPDSLYDELEGRVMREASEMGITPAERQAQIWCEMSGNRMIYADLICQYPLGGV